MITTIENKIFIFNLARKDETSKYEYLIELAKDIVELVEKVERTRNINNISIAFRGKIQEVKDFVLEDEIRLKKIEMSKYTQKSA